ncbi:MAG: hypothetical protein CM1200mP41_23200 [Gammaproteobacteria bacterium]|nr:MAG: hypothetical protein CM1200mP41_23200 [Gammaproteobacteria bacterium]
MGHTELHHVPRHESTLRVSHSRGFGNTDSGNSVSREKAAKPLPLIMRRRENYSQSDSVVVVPGFGMAVAHAQHPVSEMTAFFRARTRVRFAIHPVAGRCLAI